jgi:hypothetical protein
LQVIRRNKKFLWEIRDEDGNVHTGQEAIKKEVVSYFHTFFKDQGSDKYTGSVGGYQSVSKDCTGGRSLYFRAGCYYGGDLEVLKGFSKDKSLGPDGWTVEFFLFFIDLVGPDLLAMVEETRIRGEVIRPLKFYLSCFNSKIKPTIILL